MLLSAAPDLKNADPEDEFATWFSKKVIKLMKKENFVKILPNMINDASSAVEQIAARCGTSSGIFDPFEAMHRIIFQLTNRTVGITEIAESPKLLSQSLKLIQEIGENYSPTRIIFPWLPTLNYMKRTIAAGRFSAIIQGLAEDRKRSGRQECDAMQVLLDEGESGTKTVEASLLTCPFAIPPLRTM